MKIPSISTTGLLLFVFHIINPSHRKKEAWDLLIDEAVELCSKYRIDGLHLDDAQCWPNILEADIQELERKDTDGSPAYTPEDVFYGNIVAPRTFSGYWNTE